jgi:hypothetical protein
MARVRFFVRALLFAFAVTGICACESELDQQMFQRRAEKIFTEVNPGFGIIKRRKTSTVFVRGDQFYELQIASAYMEYEAGGKKTSAFLDSFRNQLAEEASKRKQTLDSASKELIPFIKSGSWINAQDLGAIGPKKIRRKVRPWRKKIAEDVYVLIGIPEELLGYRYASMEEVEESKTEAKVWLQQSITNLVKDVGTSTATILRSSTGNLMVLDFSAVDNVAALILDPASRLKWLKRFDLTELGVSIANRDVLIVFDPADFVTIKPIRARTYELYDNRNHPGFRGLLRIDRDTISMMEPAYPKKKKRRSPK